MSETASPNRFGVVASRRSGPKPTPGSTGEEQRKYTVMLTPTIADTSDEDVLSIRRKVGRKVDKSEVIRELLSQLHNDPTLMATVAEALARRS